MLPTPVLLVCLQFFWHYLLAQVPRCASMRCNTVRDMFLYLAYIQWMTVWWECLLGYLAVTFDYIYLYHLQIKYNYEMSFI